MKRGGSKITIFAVLTTATILVWVAAEAYQRLKKTEVISIPGNILAPITPSLDKSVLDNMEERLWVPESEVNLPLPTPAETSLETREKVKSPSGEQP